MLRIFKTGFSLMEMVIVLVIIGILFASISNITGSIDYAKINTTKSQIFQIHKAVNDYMASHEGLMSYSLLKSKYPDFANPDSEGSLWDEYFDGSVPKNGFGKPWNVNVVNGELEISSDVRKSTNCEKISKSIQDQVSSVQCEETILKVYFNDGN